MRKKNNLWLSGRCGQISGVMCYHDVYKYANWHIKHNADQSILKSLQKHAYSNISKNLQPQKEKKSDKKFWYFFHISAQNKDCWYSLEPPRRGGSNEYQQSMFLSRNKKNNVYPCKP